ncbi:Putative luciferase-like protein [Mycobacteroides abscessus subsp. abscessus]|nr:Putative luciferase-like protein [Mycobacteroides abscessus subsp. abscessus]
MHALTLDHLSGGRAVLGLGVSGPQVVEGWYGQPFAKPLQRTREYVGIIRTVLAREAPVTSDGPHYPLPYTGPGATGLGKPLKPIVHPLRADLPIRSPTAGWRSTSRRGWPTCTTGGWTRALPGRARAAPARTSRSRPAARW